MRGEDFPPCFLYYLLEIAKLIKMCMVHNLHSLDLSFAIAGFLYIQICNPAPKPPGKKRIFLLRHRLQITFSLLNLSYFSQNNSVSGHSFILLSVPRFCQG